MFVQQGVDAVEPFRVVHTVPSRWGSPAPRLTDANDRTLQRRAGQITIKEIEKALREHKAFGFESTYSGRSRPALVERVKGEGESRPSKPDPFASRSRPARHDTLVR